jgi:PAS domain S-box-containing protein
MLEISKASDNYEKEVNRNLFLLIDNLDDSIITCDNLQGIITNCNKSTGILYGYEKEELIGKSISILYPEDCKNEIYDVLGKLKDGIKINHFETIRKKRNGDSVIVSISISPIYGNNDKIDGMVSIARDMTEKYKLINESIESEEKYKFAIEGGNFGVWDWNIKNNQIYYSKRWKEMLGYEEDEIGNGYREWTNRIHKEDFYNVRDKVNRHFKGEEFKIEYRLKCKDDNYIWVKTIGKVTKWDNEGKPVRMIGINADINEEMLQRKKIQTSENRLLGIYNSMSIGICLGEIISDNEGIAIDYKFLHVNNAMEKIIGTETQNFEKTFKLLHINNKNMIQIFSEVALKGKHFNSQMYIKNVDKYLDINIYSPNPMQFALFATDITENKKKEQELSDKYEELSCVYDELTVIEEELRTNYCQ